MLLASLQALAASGDAAIADRTRALVDDHRDWIAGEVEHFVKTVVDPSTGLVRSDRAFSAHRDTFRNGSTAYANAMVALLGRVVVETGWAPDLLSHHFAPDGFVFPDSRPGSHVPPAMPVAGIRTDRAGSGVAAGSAAAADATGSGSAASATASGAASDAASSGAAADATASRAADQAARMTATGIADDDDDAEPDFGHTKRQRPGHATDWGLLLRQHFWLGDRFRDRLGTDDTSGEANVWPFHLGLIADDGEVMLAAALETLRRDGYTLPFPLRFEASHRADGLLLAYRLWSPDYQTTTSWTSLGSVYLSLLRRVDPAAARVELDRTRALLERDQTFWEVLDASGQPWRSRSRLSISDVSMLWGAILLETLEADRADRTSD